MDNEAPGAMVFGFAHELFQAVVQAAAMEGERGAFCQVLDDDPENPDAAPELRWRRMSRDDARRELRSRQAEGFKGLMGFSCLESFPDRLLVEAFDTRNDVSIALSCPVKRTFFGKLKQTAQAEMTPGAEALI